VHNTLVRFRGNLNLISEPEDVLKPDVQNISEVKKYQHHSKYPDFDI
jgi:hypothetical protein